MYTKNLPKAVAVNGRLSRAVFKNEFHGHFRTSFVRGY